MTKPGKKKQACGFKPPGAVELLEDAFLLLRRMPASWWLGYCGGTFPFVLGLLYFWSDMARGLFADTRCGMESFVLVVLFVWMGFWQSRAGAELVAQQHDEPLPKLRWRQALRIWTLQMAVQGAAFILLPVAFLILLPTAWTYAFFTQLGIQAWREPDSTSWTDLYRRGVRLAGLWQGQINGVFLIISLLGFLVYLDFTIGFFLLPAIWKALTGIESVFTRSGFFLLGNTTFQALVLSMTYVVLRPLLLAACALRSFYGNAQTSGADLRIRFRRAIDAARGLGVVLLFAGLTASSVAVASTAAPQKTVSPVTGQTFKRVADEVLARPEFAWRLPRLRQANESVGVFTRFAREAMRTLKIWVKKSWDLLSGPVEQIFDWLNSWGSWLRNKLIHSQSGLEKAPASPIMESLMWILLAAIIGGGLWFLFRYWQRRRRRKNAVATLEALPAAAESEPDLEADYVPPEDLPYQRWLTRAGELAANGDYRPALRALYLAALALLADRRMVIPARSKTNGDYRNEVRRHRQSCPSLPGVFTDLIMIFEGVWYGAHPANADLYERTRLLLQEIETTFSQVEQKPIAT